MPANSGHNGHNDQDAPPTPTIELNSKLMRQSTLHFHEPTPEPPNGPLADETPSEEEEEGETEETSSDTNLGERLRDFLFTHADNQEAHAFIPAELLRERVTAEMVEEELARLPPQPTGAGHRPLTAAEIHESHLVVFSALSAVERGSEIWSFVKAGISDSKLPLLRRPPKFKNDRSWVLEVQEAAHTPSLKVPVTSAAATLLGKPRTRRVSIEGFERRIWGLNSMETLINQWQWQLTVPKFSMGEHDRALHHNFLPQVILPWSPFDHSLNKGSNKPLVSEHGGFGSVKSVHIDTQCHAFHPLLEKLNLRDNLFALKTLHSSEFNDEDRFRHEVEQLRRFNGVVHGNLVTLLTSFTQNGKYHFLFPLADCDLSGYFEGFQHSLRNSPQTARWFAAQFFGLMGALDAFHNPPNLPGLSGRHGDLKPDNILWYRPAKDVTSGKTSPHEPSGMLVISDLGLSAVNREGSRSNIPNKNIPPTPGYRPPECDIEGGKINRDFDIWTMGCIFMEMCVWLLGGVGWLEQFRQDRLTTAYLTGVGSDIFFDIKKDGNKEGAFVMQVKEEVTAWFDKMRNHKDCSQFILDVLKLVEGEMIVIISEERVRRMPSGTLKTKFEDIQNDCNKSDDYCISPATVPLPGTRRTTTAVETTLSPFARDLYSRRQPALLVHRGKTASAAPPKDEKAAGSG